MALPQGYEERSREEWLKLAQDSDPQKRKIVSNCVRDLGVAPTDYMGWDQEARVDYIMKHQGGGAKESATEEKTSSKKDKATPSAEKGSSGGGGVDAATKKAIAEIQEEQGEQRALLRKIHDLLVVAVLSDKQAKGNAEEMDVELKLLGNG